MRKDDLRIIKTLANANFKDIGLFTNGLMFYLDDMLQAFIDNGVTSISLHVSAVEEKLYETLTRRNGTYSILMQTLEKIAGFPNINLSIITVVNKLNIKHLINISNFFYEYNKKVNFKKFFHYLVFYSLYSSVSNGWENRSWLIPRMKDAVPYIKEALDSVNTYSSKTSLLYTRLPFCLMEGYEVYSYDLYASPAKLHSDNNEGIKTNNSYIDTLYTKKQNCIDCIHNKYCVGIMKGYAKMFGLDEFNPVTI